MSDRSQNWDNLKGILIFLVVYAHFLYGYRSIHSVNFVFEFIYVFHMPAFIYVSGALTKAPGEGRKTATLEILLSYLIFNTIMMLYSAYVLGNEISLIRPYFSCWYLLALLFWRFAARFVPRSYWVLGLAVIVSLLVGWLSSVGNELALARTIGFFPFFWWGYLRGTKQSPIPLPRQAGWRSFIALVLGLGGGALAFYLCTLEGFNLRDQLLYAYTDGLIEIAYRVLMFASAACIIVFLVAFAPNRRLPLITQWGRYSLTIYLIHRIITLVAARVWPSDELPIPVLIFALLASVLTMLVLGSRPVGEAYSKLVSAIAQALHGMFRLKKPDDRQ